MPFLLPFNSSCVLCWWEMEEEGAQKLEEWLICFIWIYTISITVVLALNATPERTKGCVCVCDWGGGWIKRRISAATRAMSNNLIYTESLVVPKPLKVRWGELPKPWKSGFSRKLFCTCNGAIQWHIYVCALPETLASAQEVAVRQAVTGIYQTSVALSLSLSVCRFYKTVFTPQIVTVALVKCCYCCYKCCYVGNMCELYTHLQLTHIYSMERIIQSIPLNTVCFSRSSTNSWGTATSLSVVS